MQFGILYLISTCSQNDKFLGTIYKESSVALRATSNLTVYSKILLLQGVQGYQLFQ